MTGPLAVTGHRALDQRETEAGVEMWGHQSHQGSWSWMPSTGQEAEALTYFTPKMPFLLLSKTMISLKEKKKKEENEVIGILSNFQALLFAQLQPTRCVEVTGASWGLPRWNQMDVKH